MSNEHVATVNWLWRNPESGIKLHGEVPLFLEVPEFPYNTVLGMSKEAPVPKTSSIRSSVSIELRLVTDTDTDRHASIASCMQSE